MRLFRVGNRIINLDLIVAVSFIPLAHNPVTQDTWTECSVSFGCDDVETFYNQEAVFVWTNLCTLETHSHLATTEQAIEPLKGIKKALSVVKDGGTIA